MCSTIINTAVDFRFYRVKWKLIFFKSSVMWFKASNRSTQFTYPPISVAGGVVLEVTEKQKYLGLIFDCTMSWTHHITNVYRIMSYYLCLLRSHQHVIDNSLLKIYYWNPWYCLICLTVYTVWGRSLGSTLLQRLQRMQNCAVRMCYNVRKYDHGYHRLQWLSFSLNHCV